MPSFWLNSLIAALSVIAACDLHEAITHLQKWHLGLDVLRVEFVAMIEIVSGSPLN